MDWNSGMAFGLALIIIFVMYLVDKHHRWMALVKITAGLLVLSVLGELGTWGWIAWADYRAEKLAQYEQQHNGLRPGETLGPIVVDHSAVDCYDAQGNLQPDESKAFNGITTGCGRGQTAKPTTERANIPSAMRLRVEQIEACQKKAAADPQDTPAKFAKCSATPPAPVFDPNLPYESVSPATRHRAIQFPGGDIAFDWASDHPLNQSDKGCSGPPLNAPYVLTSDGICRPRYPKVEAKEWNQLAKGCVDPYAHITTPPETQTEIESRHAQCMGRVITEREKNGTKGLYW